MRSELSYISEVHNTELSQGAYNLSAYLIGNVQLRQAHVRRAEQRVLMRCHSDWIYSKVAVEYMVIGGQRGAAFTCLR